MTKFHSMVKPWLLIVALLVPSSLQAQASEREPLVTDRPDFTESAVTVGTGRVQLEGGYTLARVDDLTEHALGEVLLRIGLGPRAELRLAPGSFVWTEGDTDDASGLDDGTLGAKLVLAAPPGARGLRPAAALLLSTSVPTGAAAFGENAWQPEAKLALAWELSDRLALAANVGAAAASEAGERFGQGTGSLTAALALTPRLGGYVEGYGFLPAGPDGADAGYLNSGLTLLFGPDVQLDARIGIGFSAAEPDVFLGVGASRRW
ncbi:MAG: transporter [Gemmatimonadota bacterium]